MIVTTETLRTKLVPISDEMSVVTPFNSWNYQAGLVLFQPGEARDDKWITHTDAEVLSYVLEGQGRLRLQDEESTLAPGAICHIARNTPHDFVAEGEAPLLMFYVTIKVSSETA